MAQGAAVDFDPATAMNEGTPLFSRIFSTGKHEEMKS
jgi:hypothetical protein